MRLLILVNALLSLFMITSLHPQEKQRENEFELSLHSRSNQAEQRSDFSDNRILSFREKMLLLKNKKTDSMTREGAQRNQSDSQFEVIGATGEVEREWIRHFSTGFIASTDVPTSIAINPKNGDVHVTGYATNQEFGSGFYTIKYDSSGNEIWNSQYNAVPNGDDLPLAMVLDASGNVYVTGLSWTEETGYDFATVKYNQNGVQQWVARYNGVANGDDGAVDLAVDSAGNIYVCGLAWGGERTYGGTEYDYVTIKYSSDGTQEWLARYDGDGIIFSGDEIATAIAIDQTGNVYVTGESKGDWATVKYNSQGILRWVSRFAGINVNRANDLVVDDEGNVYVTGYDAQAPGNIHDYITIKYDSSGAELWVARYNGTGNHEDEAIAIALDASDNVYVTGNSNVHSDFVTIKYNSDGVEQWVAIYSGPSSSIDQPTGLTVDDSGNVYVTGFSRGLPSARYATVKYNSEGVEQWIAHYDTPFDGILDDEAATAIGIDNAGNVFVTGWSIDGTGADYATLKYNIQGVQQWLNRYDGNATSIGSAEDMVIDHLGNIYVLGTIIGLGTGSELAIIKYDSAGSLQWATHYDPGGNWEDRAVAIDVDNQGNAYVLGNKSYTSGGFVVTDYITTKFNSTGLQEWVATFNNPGLSNDEAVAFAVDKLGNAYVTGGSTQRGTIGSTNLNTLKYNPEGIEQWSVRYDGGPTAITIDDSGNVYVTGGSRGSETGLDYTTVKYNNSGTEQWVARYNGPGNDFDIPYAIAVDHLGNVYVTGESEAGSFKRDYATIKYNSSGVEQWVARYNGPGNSTDVARAMIIDDLGNVYVTGRGGGILSDYVTIKYSLTGVQQWVAQYDGPEGGPDIPEAIALDGLGNVYVTGSSNVWDAAPVSVNFLTIKYNNDGVEQWVGRYNGSGHARDEANAIALDASGNVYISGSSIGASWSVFTTIKYAQNQLPPNQNPVITSQPDTVAFADSLYKYQITASDPEGDFLKYHLLVAPHWLTVDSLMGQVQGTPTQADIGDTTVTVQVSDGKGGAASQTFTLKVSSVVVGIDTFGDELPATYELFQNYPNPFNPATTIRFNLPKPSHVLLSIYNLRGQVVTVLVDENLPAGSYATAWNARSFSSGVYIVRIRAGEFVMARKLSLVR